MLDILLLREDQGGNVETVREMQRRRYAPMQHVDDVLELDAKWRAKRSEVDNLNKEYNAANKAIGMKKKAKEECDDMIAANKERDLQCKAAQVALNELEAERTAKLSLLGNLVHDSVPVDDNEDNNAVVRTYGEPRKEEGLLNHVDLFYRFAGSDTERGCQVAGNRGYFLKGAGVLLNMALINYGISFLNAKKYTPLQTPFFMEKTIMGQVSQLSQFDEELYKVTGDGEEKYLIATSEQPICAYHKGEWIAPERLPIKYAGYSTCFRKEAGSHGRDTAGIFRIHQFEKIEQFVITSPDDEHSWEALEEMIATSEEFYRSLGLPFRVINIVSGALNDAAAKKYDLEAWFPGSQTYRELVSCSNCTDFQSRRLEVRFGQVAKAKDTLGPKEKKFVHMLNGTLCATERAMCCIVENYQKEDGIVVPEILRPYMGGMDFIPFVQDLPPRDKSGKKAKDAK